IAGLKKIGYRKLMAERPEFAMTVAIKGMLPANTIGDKSMTRLKVYAGATHEQAAQKPETI
ncbi:MAG: uL13 family ribosomal protein, partial [Clostridia bacterium]|nr:uL13 family ribosomal protein [Clostridia bacterium]